MKTKLLTLTGALAILIVGAILLASAGQALNASEEGVCQKTTDASCSNGKSCASSASPTLSWKSSESQYSEAEQKLIQHFSDRIAATGQARFDLDEVAKATGLPVNVVEGISLAKLQPAIRNELAKRNVDLSSLAGQNCGNCSKFSACSVDRDLNGATGDELLRYEKEKAQDGMTFSDWTAPDFALPTTDGKTVRLSEYEGRPVVVTFLSGHCSHSFDTLPILAELKKKYESLGLAILPVYVNSGSVENILTWSSEMDLGFSLLVSEDKKVSDAYDSRMVPSAFLVDKDGQITKKLVGFQDKTTLDAAFAGLVKG